MVVFLRSLVSEQHRTEETPPLRTVWPKHLEKVFTHSTAKKNITNILILKKAVSDCKSNIFSIPLELPWYSSQ